MAFEINIILYERAEIVTVVPKGSLCPRHNLSLCVFIFVHLATKYCKIL